MKTLLMVGLLLGTSLLGACGGNPYDDDPLLKPPQLVETDKEKKS